MKLHQQIDGEWVQPRKRNYTLVCCDCGLTHRVNFRIRDGRIQFQAFRTRRCRLKARR